MGTPAFGARILEEIMKEHEVVLVVTQPDRAIGRKKEVIYSPVKELALKYNLSLLQPIKIKEIESQLLQYHFDIIVTAAFGQFVGKHLLDYPQYKAINVHGSLLPKYRGGAPIQRAIINGDKITGITIMYMDKKMDAGDIIMQETLPILDDDDSDSLFAKMAELGAKMINPCLDSIVKGKVKAIHQDESLVSYAYTLTKEDEKISFLKKAVEVRNQIRGLSSNPGAYFELDNSIYKVYKSRIGIHRENVEPGIITNVGKDYFSVACGDGIDIEFTEIKPEGKNNMRVKDFLNGKGKNILIKNRRVM